MRWLVMGDWTSTDLEWYLAWQSFVIFFGSSFGRYASYFLAVWYSFPAFSLASILTCSLPLYLVFFLAFTVTFFLTILWVAKTLNRLNLRVRKVRIETCCCCFCWQIWHVDFNVHQFLRWFFSTTSTEAPPSELWIQNPRDFSKLGRNHCLVAMKFWRFTAMITWGLHSGEFKQTRTCFVFFWV